MLDCTIFAKPFDFMSHEIEDDKMRRPSTPEMRRKITLR